MKKVFHADNNIIYNMNDVIDCNFWVFLMINSTPLLNIDEISSQHQQFFDEQHIYQLLDGLEHHGFYIIDDVYPTEILQSLRIECMQHQAQFKQAEIQNGRIQDIRSDYILWIDERFTLAQQHLAYLLGLAYHINRAFYLGIYEIEGHFAHYHTGEFYKLHRDNPQGKNGRLISSVYYLHEYWQQGDGGELRLQDKHGHWHLVHPNPNRLVIFQSDLLHEVLVNQKDRLSITAWLRQRS